MPASRHGVAEGVQAAEGIAGGSGGRGENDAGSANGGRDRTRLQNAHSHGAGALIASTGGNRRACLEAGELRGFVADVRANLRRLEQLRQPAFRNAGDLGHFFRPAAMRHVEQQRAGGFLHIHGISAGQAIADVIFGAENVRDAREDFRLVLLDPQQLGQREVGQRGISGQLDEPFAADDLVQPLALRLGAHVAPDERGAEDFAVFIEHDGAMHLAGQADGIDVHSTGQHFANGLLRGTPPVFRILLSPARMRCAKRLVLGGSRTDQLPFFIHQHGACAAGAYIHSQKHGRSPMAIRTNPQQCTKTILRSRRHVRARVVVL